MSESRPAAIWRREFAHILDSLAALGAWSLCGAWLCLGVWALRGWPRTGSEILVLVVALEALALALHAVYHISFVGGCGQTPGKMALGIVVVRRDGARAGYGRAALRVLGGLLSVLTLGLGYAGIVLTRQRRGLADWLAGTRVVRV